MRKTILALFLLALSSSLTFAAQECKTEMDTYGKNQTITANLLNYLNDPAKLREATDFYGEQNKLATSYIKQGKYQEACDAYQKVIDKYEMKTIEEQYYEKYPEKRPGAQKKAEVEAPAATSTTMEAADSAVGAPAAPAQ